MEASPGSSRLSLLELLQNSLVLGHTSPYIGLNGLMSLGAASKSFRSLLFGAPQVFNRIDLSNNKSCTLILRNSHGRHMALESSLQEVQDCECTFEEYLARPIDTIMGHLVRLDILRDIRTLILDGLAVPSILLSALFFREIKHDIRLLSLRGVEESNSDSFVRCVRYLIRNSRPRSRPEIKGLYYFTSLEKTTKKHVAVRSAKAAPMSAGITNAVGAQLGSEPVVSEKVAQDNVYTLSVDGGVWYTALGCVQINNKEQQLADLVEACEGLIAFDATICRHDRALYNNPRPRIANVRLSGCQSCGSSPEGPAYPGKSIESHLPLVSPPPMHSFSVKSAQCLDVTGPQPAFIARCTWCLKDRWCEQCNAWWCEECYDVPRKRPVPALPSAEDSQGVIVLPPTQGIKVHNGLCISKCLVDELLTGGGEGGMWG